MLNTVRPNRVKELRDFHALSQQKLIDKLNEVCGTTYSQRAVTRWEKQENNIPINILIAMSLIFRCSIEYIMYVTDDEIPLTLTEEYKALLPKAQFE